MRIVRGPASVLRDEMVVAVHPPLSPFVDAAWRRRSSYFTGRAVSHLALSADQEERAGRLAAFGQGLCHGVVQGLEVDLVTTGSAPELRVGPGFGLAITGEDVALTRELKLPLASVPVWPDGSTPALGSTGVFALVLEPVEEERTSGADPTDPCELDPSNYSYEDRVRVDAARLWRLPLDLGVAPAPRFRNELVSAIFELERTHPVWQLPWLEPGVPIALVAWAPGQPMFADRFAVSRPGGGPRAPRQVARKAGRAPLWRARVEQFVAELGSVSLPDLKSEGLSSRFRFLPPIAALPPDALVVRTSGADLPLDDLLPVAWSVRALPVPLESLDDVFEASASLEPLDVEAEEQVEVLVPVPGAWFDPRLLVTEVVGVEFYEAVYKFRIRLLRSLQARGTQPLSGTARRHDFAIERLLTGRSKTYEPDTDTVAGETQEPTKPDGVPVYNVSIPVEDLSKELSNELDALRGELTSELSAAELDDLIGKLGKPVGERPTPLDSGRAFPDEFAGLGLDGFIAKLAERLEQADDRLDVNFLRLHSDVYRIKQHVAGNTAGTQLATSPALADIARSVLAAPTTTALKEFATAIKGTVRELDAETAPSDAPATTFSLMAAPVTATMALWTPTFIAAPVAAPAPAPSTPLMLAPEREVFRVRPLSENLMINVLGSTNFPLEESPPPAISFKKNIKERFAAPPAPESHRFAVESKVGALRLIADIHEKLGLPLAGLSFPGFRTSTAEETRTVEQLLASNRALIAEVASGKHDGPNGDDESAFYAAGARALEDAVALMRLVEGRLAVYKRTQQRCSDARTRIAALVPRSTLQLGRLEESIAEARHDVRVGELLTAEEEKRVQALNTRRDDVVQKHVPYLLLRRPRVWEGSEAFASYALEAGTVVDPLPSCREGNFEAPDQLREMVDLFADAPVGWFPNVRPQLDLLNRMDSINQTLQHAVLRSRAEQPVFRAAFSGEAISSTPLGQRIQNVFTARFSAVRQSRPEIASLDVTSVLQASWSSARRQAERIVSLGDLIDAKHGRQDASRAAAAELEDLYRVAACLFGHFRDVPPAIRLAWAERYSQFDSPPDFRRLEGLERFQELERHDRRELQLLVDWLFQRIDQSVPDAIGLMNDLVRVALLLSSHAPVNQIVEADVAPNQTASVGGSVRILVDVSRVRVGMHVSLLGQSAGQIVGRGLVSDVGAGGASVKIVSTTSVQIAPLRAQLSEPARHAAELHGAALEVGAAGLFEVRSSRG
jgi:hypothetical protein